MHKEKVASLYSTVDGYCVHPLVPLSFTKPLLHLTGGWTPLWLCFQGQTAHFCGWYQLNCLRPATADQLKVHLIQKLPQHPSHLMLRPSLTNLIQQHMPTTKKPPFYRGLQQHQHSAKDMRNVASVPCWRAKWGPHEQQWPVNSGLWYITSVWVPHISWYIHLW